MSALTPVAEDLWIAEGETVRFFGMPFPTRMTVVRLASGALWLHSPIRPSDALCAELDALGEVAHLISPNKIHHLFMGDFAARYPGARLYASPGLAKRREDLRFDATLDDAPEAAWADALDQLVVRGSKVMEEVVFLHRSSRTLIVADLIENFDPKTLGPVFRVVARLGGVVHPHGGMPRDWRLSFRDRETARACVERILAWGPERIILSHGLCVSEDAGGFLQRSFAWLTGQA
ncbi:MAG: DUF4336 domain-containing protein [Nannocystaceae bacterium]|nr:DUF4336 domain-containing protein [Myxococcales bacterium]